MPFGFELPTSPLERAAMLENLLVARATGDMNASNHDYEQLRRDFIDDPELKALLPPLSGPAGPSMYSGPSSRIRLGPMLSGAKS
ncbi:hypothetical protein ACF1BQ_036755 [Bradyrhizobium sp. RDT10]